MSDKIKAVVVKKFRNKYSKTIHEAGDILDLSPTRLAEINSAGHGVLVEEIDVEATLADVEPENVKDKPPKTKKK